MITKDNIEELMKKFKDNYKISEVCYIKSSKLLCLNILTLLKFDLDINTAEIEGDIKNALNLDINYNFNFHNPVETREYFFELISKFLKERHNYDAEINDLEIEFSESIRIKLKLINSFYLKHRILCLEEELKKVICKQTFKNVEISFDVKVSEILQGESTKSSNNILLDREKLLNSGIGEFKQEQKDYKIRGLDIVVGKNFTDVATCLSQIKSEYDFIQVAGKVRYFTERTFKKKVVKDEVESEEEKIYFTFELFDGFGKIKASYFPTKAFIEKQIKIEDGQIVTICGKIEEYRESLSLKVKEIAFCCLPEGQLPEKREENLTANPEIKIDNESMSKMEYKTEPENYMVAFPSNYKEPNQMDLFASFGNVEQVCDMLNGKDYVVFDLETTGLDYSKNEIIEIGAVKVRNGKIIEVFNTFCKPSQSISSFITELTGISDDIVAFAPKFEDVVGDFFKFTRNSTLVAHNSDFDTLFLDYHAGKFMYKFDNPVIDTLVMSRRLLSGMKNHKLATIAKHFNIPLDHAHRALYDTIATAKCFIELCKLECK